MAEQIEPMKAFILDVPKTLLEARRRLGLDCRDEVWDGVLHMLPPPRRRHQRLVFLLESWLEANWAKAGHGKVFHELAVSPLSEDWTSDYRVPDLVLLSPDRYGIDCDTHLFGPPLVIVEVRSPEDETTEKLDFYASLGVPEVWIIDSNTLHPQIHYCLDGAYFQPQSMDAEDWLTSPSTGIRLRAAETSELEMQLGSAVETYSRIQVD